jgi:hypothetical protein
MTPVFSGGVLSAYAERALIDTRTFPVIQSKSVSLDLEVLHLWLMTR